LNITVPTNIPQGEKLPVLVFLHGGGFSIGGNSWPQYDMGRLVQLSAEVNQAIIGITIK
jgi:carboxylesterase type B